MIDERAVRGVPWTLSSYAIPRLLTFVTMIVLARVLAPSDFGLMALAILVVGFLTPFRDLGLGATLILRQDLDRHAMGTLLTLAMGTATVIAALLAALAPLLAAALGDQRLTEILLALTTVVLLGGFAAFYDSLLQRELEFRKRFSAQLAQSLAIAAVSVALALAGVGVWSLVIGQIAGFAVYAVATVALSPFRVKPSFDRGAARSGLATAKGFLLQGALGWLRQNLDYLAVGRLLGPTALGYYSMAYRVGDLIPTGVADPVAKVTFPAFARMRADRIEVVPAFLSTLKLVALVAWLLAAVLTATAGPFAEAVFGERWLAMIPVLAIFGPWAAIRAVKQTLIWLLNATGHATTLAKLTAGLLVPLVPAVYLAAHLGAISTVAWVLLADSFLSTIAFGVCVARREDISLSSQMAALRPALLAAPGAWAAARGVVEVGEPLAPGALLGLATVAGVSVYLVLVRWIEPGLLGYTLGQVRRALRHPGATEVGVESRMLGPHE